MVTKRRILAMLALVATLAACAPSISMAPAGTKSQATKKPSSKTPVTLPGAGSLTPVPPPSSTPTSPGLPVPSPGAGGHVVPITGSGVLTNNGASLTGSVRVPAHLIGNNGSGLISNNGSSYRLQAVSQQPLAGVEVRVLDAQGRPIQGPNGAELKAVTDAQGRYAFTGQLPTRNLRLAVALAADKGDVQAILPGATGTDAQLRVDLDLISTLTTTYILDQYIAKSQADPQATLDKLPGELEADTRSKAQQAFEATQAEAPPTLTPADMVATVTALRQRDAAFNDQMEVVKRLLIAGGFSDLGNGKPATQVGLNYASKMAVAPDGTLYIMSEYDQRVWRLRPDGTIVTAVGTAGAAKAEVDGLKGTEVALSSLQSIAVDAQGRVLILEGYGGGRILRLNQDGTITRLATGGARDGFIMAGDGDEAYYLDTYTWDTTGTLYKVVPGQGLVRLAALDFGTGTHLWGCGRTSNGEILAWLTHGSSGTGLATGLYTIAPQTGAFTKLMDGDYELDSAGHVFRTTESDLTTIEAGTTRPVGTLPDGGVAAVAALPGGGAFVSDFFRIYKVTAAGATHVAGIPKTGPIDVAASDFGYQQPSGLAIAPDGTMFVADQGLNRVLRIGTDGRLRNIEPSAGIPAPRIVRLGPGGDVYAGPQQLGSIQKISNGALSSMGSFSNHTILDFVIGPAGELYAAEWWWTGEDNYKITCQKNGVSTVILEHQPSRTASVSGYGLALAPDGALMIVGGGQLQRWTAADGLSTVVSHGALAIVNGPGASESCPGIALDAEGRIILAAGSTVKRFDPRNNSVKALASPGAAYFSGTGVDDGINSAGAPAFAPDGSLLFVDTGNRQLKRIPEDGL